jgi:hypothetical protein
VTVATKTEAASQIREILQSVKDQMAKPGGAGINEATTRAHFLNPLLNALGYAGVDDLGFEFYLPDGKTFLDYRLFVDGAPRVAVEAKALGVAITDKEAAQGVSYASILGDEWTVLTNARTWRLYHTFAQAPLAGKLVLDLDLVSWASDADFDRVFDQLWLVSRDSFLSGGGPGTWLTSQKLDHHLRHAMVDPASAEVKYIRKQLEVQSIAVSVDAVAAWFRQRLASAAPGPATKPSEPTKAPAAHAVASPVAPYAGAPTAKGTCWIVPAGKAEGFTAREHLEHWLGREFWGFGESTAGRKSMKIGDRLCFYAAGEGVVVAYATLSGPTTAQVGPDEWPGPNGYEPGAYKLPLADVTWLDEPIELTAALRSKLDAYQGKGPNANWSWLVQTTHRISESDFLRLTGQSSD